MRSVIAINQKQDLLELLLEKKKEKQNKEVLLVCLWVTYREISFGYHLNQLQGMGAYFSSGTLLQ